MAGSPIPADRGWRLFGHQQVSCDPGIAIKYLPFWQIWNGRRLFRGFFRPARPGRVEVPLRILGEIFRCYCADVPAWFECYEQSEPYDRPNVTVAAVIEKMGNILLVEEQTSNGFCSNQLAGHLEPEESIIQGSVRETLEETGYVFVQKRY
jgi:hypothetical protein